MRITPAMLANAKQLPSWRGPAPKGPGRGRARAISRPEPRAGRPPANIAQALGVRKRASSPDTPFRPHPGRPPQVSDALTTQPRGPWSNVDPIPEKGTLQNPFTDRMTAPPSGPQLARPVSNAGSSGQNARYHVGPGSGLTRGERGWTDGVYWYDDNGLSLDRPDASVAGLAPADESEGYDPWSGRSRSSGGGGGSPIASALAGGTGASHPASSAALSGLLSGGPTSPASDGFGGFAQGESSLPEGLLEFIRSLMARTGSGNRAHQPL